MGRAEQGPPWGVWLPDAPASGRELLCRGCPSRGGTSSRPDALPWLPTPGSRRRSREQLSPDAPKVRRRKGTGAAAPAHPSAVSHGAWGALALPISERDPGPHAVAGVATTGASLSQQPSHLPRLARSPHLSEGGRSQGGPPSRGPSTAPRDPQTSAGQRGAAAGPNHAEGRFSPPRISALPPPGGRPETRGSRPHGPISRAPSRKPAGKEGDGLPGLIRPRNPGPGQPSLDSLREEPGHGGPETARAPPPPPARVFKQ
ncbi:proline-rich proteoglycan 2-like [Tachyglossus aculeatus]|uniref:proline-rich proteoglycan 2-like n=1 Tax=Tachyglossus aculeatus TaxID=9261 RepID=UPI0018F2BFD9|nr:proline-rich proteoglycan 2-like [Tachyglossus aculeatus]